MNYLNERTYFTPEQVVGMMFTKLKQITNTESATKPIDCVVGVSFSHGNQNEKKTVHFFIS